MPIATPKSKLKNKYKEKFERANENFGKLKAKLATSKDECKKIRLDADHSRLRAEKAETTLGDYQSVVQEQSTKYTAMKLEHDASQSKILSLRSSESHILDRIEKAVAAAEAVKDHVSVYLSCPLTCPGPISEL